MARYRDALHWIVENDDTVWLDDPDGCISVSAALVADLFGKDDHTVTVDLRRERVRIANRNAREET